MQAKFIKDVVSDNLSGYKYQIVHIQKYGLETINQAEVENQKL